MKRNGSVLDACPKGRRMNMLTPSTRGIGIHLASLLTARTLLGAHGLTARNQKLLVTRASLLDLKLIYKYMTAKLVA